MNSIAENLKKYLYKPLFNAIMASGDVETASEIRLRVGRHVYIRHWDREERLEYTLCKNELNEIFSGLIEYSPYAHREELNRGYVTIDGGWRVGIAGTAIEENGRVVNIKDISSLNIRIAREVIGCSSPVNIDSGNVIIISPPGCGKTTLLRDIIRRWSNAGRNVAVIDERNEISGTYLGVPQLDIGSRTDVVINSGKKNGFDMVLRAMAPDVIAADEIGNESDFAAVRQAMVSGVDVICTVHSTDLEELRNKTGFDKMIEQSFFDFYIVLNGNIGSGNIYKIYNKELKNIWQEN